MKHALILGPSQQASCCYAFAIVKNEQRRATTVGRNWTALTRLALAQLNDLHCSHPDWSIEDLFEVQDLPTTRLFYDLGTKAGFKARQASGKEEMLAVAAKCMQGIQSDQVIAKETGLSLERVQQILNGFAQGFGSTPFGIAPYGGKRKFSDGQSAVPRRVTTVGQISYRGHMYTLGAAYRGRTAMLLERGPRLQLTFPDRPTLTLTARHYRTNHRASV